VKLRHTVRRFATAQRELLRTSPGLIGLLATDALVTVAELAAAVVIPWWIANRGGTAAMATYAIVLAATTLVVVLAVSPLGDRYCKAMQMRYGLGGVALVLAGLAWCATRPFALLPVLGLVGANALARAFVEPPQAAILPELVSAPRMPDAIRLQKTCRALSGVLGPLLAALLLIAVGIPVAIACCSALVLIAAVVALAIPTRDVPMPAFRFHRWWLDLRLGARARWAVPMERGWTIVNFVVWIFQGPAVGILIPIKVRSLGLAGDWLGIGIASLSIGVLAGSAFGSASLVARFGRYRTRVGLGCSEGMCLAVVGLSGSPYVMVAGLVAGGFCNASMALVGATHRALAIPRTHRVRMLASGTVATQIAGSIGAALVGATLSRWSVSIVYASFGILMASSVLGFLLVPRFKEFLELDHDRVQNWYVNEYPHVFV
jgi:hypothetical protein